jgi:hypothetical protein
MKLTGLSNENDNLALAFKQGKVVKMRNFWILLEIKAKSDIRLKYKGDGRKNEG